MASESIYVTGVPRLSNSDLGDFAVRGFGRDNPDLQSAGRLLSALMVPGKVEGGVREHPNDPSLHEEVHAQIHEVYRRIVAAGLRQYGSSILPASVLDNIGQKEASQLNG